MDLNTIFDGWGTELLSLLICLIFGGIGYHFYKNGTIKQKQEAGNGAEQKQKVSEKTIKDHNDISQSQKAGDNAKQEQTI
jgi:hypothetical protein